MKYILPPGGEDGAPGAKVKDLNKDWEGVQLEQTVWTGCSLNNFV